MITIKNIKHYRVLQITFYKTNTIIKNKYYVEKQIGKGKFGVVYHGKNVKTNEAIAIKTEDNSTNTKILKHEATVLKYLYEHKCRNIPVIFWYGIHFNCTCIVMPLYEASLHHYVLNNELDIKKINNFIIKMIDILESIHNLYVIHRDIKPHNFMIRGGEIYLIDFGLSTFYVNENGDHKEETMHQHIMGSPKYISVNVHNGISSSRRDDLISIVYLYMYLYCRELPWDVVSKNNIDTTSYDELNILHYKNVYRLAQKKWEHIEEICSKINKNLNAFAKYCYQLNYKDSPNYIALKSAFSLDA